jgi:hypothetical protein
MALWKDQTPGKTILNFSVTILDGRNTVEIDIPEDTGPRYRLSVGNLFHYREVMRSNDLEAIIHRANRITQAGG